MTKTATQREESAGLGGVDYRADPKRARRRQSMNLPRKLDPASDEFNLFSSPFYLMAHADYQYHEDLDKVIAKLGLSRTAYRLMTVLLKRSPLNIGDLSMLALVKRSTASRALVGMRENGWVHMRDNDADNRLTDVALTDEGKVLVRNVMKSSSRQLQRAVAGLGDDEVNQLVQTLQKIVANLSRLPIE